MAKYEINYEALDEDQAKAKGNPYAELQEWTETIAFAFFAVILVFTFVLREAFVDGDSMNDTLKNGDKLIVSYHMYEPARGDIVIINCQNGFIYEGDQLIEVPGLDKPIVKRIVALGGEEINIDFETGDVSVNGSVIDEPYIKEATLLNENGHDFPVRVPDGYVFVMGDNRMNSTDSRSPLVGFVPEDAILGKVVFRFLPFSSFGKIE